MNKSLSIVSLRMLMLVLVGLLGGIALLFAARDLAQSRDINREVAVLVKQNGMADHGLHAIQDFAFERGRSNVVLRGEGVISAENRTLINELRVSADRHIAAVLAELPEGMSARREGLQRAWARVKWMRPELDRDFVRTRLDRVPQLSAGWLDAANALISALESTMIDLAQASARTDADYARINALRILVMQFRNMLGGESTAFGAELSANRAPNAQASQSFVGAINFSRGRSTQIWSQLEPGVRQIGGEELLLTQDRLRERLFNKLRPLQNEILHAIELGRRPQLPLDDYLAVSISTLSACVELGDAINRTSESYTKTRLEQAQRDQLSAIVRIVAILILAGLAALALFVRLTRPLRGILSHINTLLGSQSAMPIPAISRVRGDEFGRIRQALDVLEKVMVDRLRQKAALDDSERINASILASTPQAIIVTGNDGVIRVFSPGAEKMLGYAADEVVGTLTPSDLLDPQQLGMRAKRLAEALGRPVSPDWNVLAALSKTDSPAPKIAGRAARKSALSSDRREWTWVCKDGTHITVLCEATQMTRDSGETEGYLFVASDITERYRATVEMERLAHYDTLTGLPNRRLLHDRIQMAISQARRDKSRLGLMLVDLDRFKPVNDELGHAAGDALLKEASRRMHGCLRESDTLARIGGDEFVVLLSGVLQDHDALRVAEKIRAALNEPFELSGGHTVQIGCCVGLAVFPEHGKDEKRLLSSADEAMYAAKELGRNRVQLFNGIEKENSGSTGNRSEKVSFPVMRLVWHDAYLCGETSIDQEHRQIFERANELIHAVVSGDEAVVDLYDAIDDLIACAEAHFANERNVLSRCHYPELEEHVLEHQNLMERAQVLRRKAIAGELTLGALVTFIVQDVVVKHMLNEDRKYYPLLKSLQVPATAESSGMPDAA